MSIPDATRKVNELCSAWEQFKQVNERRLREIGERGSADTLTITQLKRINDNIDKCKERVRKIELSMQRPGFGPSDSDYHVLDEDMAEYKSAFRSYLRSGTEGPLRRLQTKTLSNERDADGGYFVDPAAAEEMSKAALEGSPIRQLATVQNISTASLEVLEDYTSPTVDWSGATDVVISGNTNTPRINRKTITVNELYANPKITQQLLDDASVDVEEWLIKKVGQAFAAKESEGFIKGDGALKPEGILTRTNSRSSDYIKRIKSGTNGSITVDNLIKMYYDLKEDYISGAAFLMNRATTQLIRTLKHPTSNTYIWQPNMTMGTTDTILGLPVYQAADMMAPATNSLSVVLGDFKRGYMIVDRSGVSVLRDPYTSKPMVTFYITKRVGGAVVCGEALRLLQLSA
ncbi:phage capsid protein [Rickettsiales bacterium]|nr:phage capsid protein [Rickettsiales bacterium]